MSNADEPVANTFKDQVIWITGASSGIGEALVKAFAQKDAKVVLSSRKQAELARVRLEAIESGANPDKLLVVPLDVLDSAAMPAAVQTVLDAFGRIDMLINNAGIGGHMGESFAETDFDQIGWTFNVNSIGPMRVTQALLPNVMASNAKTVVHISSIMGSIANNSGGWQWVAGCGADASPYFRIFNPVLQGKKFDGEGDYIRRWVPEIAALPNRHLHAPWEAPEPVLVEAKVRLGDTYPAPMVDHKEARAAALDAYDVLSSASDSG